MPPIGWRLKSNRWQSLAVSILRFSVGKKTLPALLAATVQRKRVGRPRVSAEIRSLIKKMAAANPLWGVHKIHGELLKLGIKVSERIVSRLMPPRSKPPSQT